MTKQATLTASGAALVQDCAQFHHQIRKILSGSGPVSRRASAALKELHAKHVHLSAQPMGASRHAANELLKAGRKAFTQWEQYPAFCQSLKGPEGRRQFVAYKDHFPQIAGCTFMGTNLQATAQA